jgi:hypothetical protein
MHVKENRYFPTKSPELSMHFCHRWRCSGFLFDINRSSPSQSATHGFLDWVLVLAVQSCDISRPRKRGSLGVPSPGYMVGTGALPSHSLQFSPTSDLQCKVVLKDGSLLCGDFHAMHVTVLVMSERSEPHWWPVCFPQRAKRQWQFP